jgi:hypothetical protein
VSDISASLAPGGQKVAFISMIAGFARLDTFEEYGFLMHRFLRHVQKLERTDRTLTVLRIRRKGQTNVDSREINETQLSIQFKDLNDCFSKVPGFRISLLGIAGIEEIASAGLTPASPPFIALHCVKLH